jgi:hypothetical protein
MAARCESKTKGTTQHGNQIKGKYNKAMLGWSKANFWNGNGAERTA